MARYTVLRLLMALLMLALVAGPVAAAGDDRNFVSPLQGENEVPAVDTRTVGVATFKLNEAETELSYKLIVANGVEVTQSHIHCGPPGVNGPVVVFLYGFGPTVDISGILAQGLKTNADVIPRADSAACPGGVANLGDVIAKMRSGGAYTNVHTVANPGGETRGPIH